MSDSGNGSRDRPGRAMLHLSECRGREQLRQFAAQQRQRVLRQPVESGPQIGRNRRLVRGDDRLGDLHIVIERDPAVVAQRQRTLRHRDPLFGFVLGESRAMRFFQCACGMHPGGEAAPLPDIGLDRIEPRGFEHRTDIVEQGRRHTIGFDGRQRKSDQPAHRGADRDELRDTLCLEQGHQITRIGANLVARGVLRVIAVAATAHRRHEHAPALRGDMRRQIFEIARIARQPMQADDRRARIGGTIFAKMQGETVGALPVTVGVAGIHVRWRKP